MDWDRLCLVSTKDSGSKRVNRMDFFPSGPSCLIVIGDPSVVDAGVSVISP